MLKFSRKDKFGSWQIKLKTKETVIEFRFRTDHIDMSNAGVYRADIDQIQQVLETGRNKVYK